MVAVLGAFMTAIVAVLSYNWRVARVAELENQLKREMLTQGRSSSEIAEVIRARPGGAWAGWFSHQRPQT